MPGAQARAARDMAIAARSSARWLRGAPIAARRETRGMQIHEASTDRATRLGRVVAALYRPSVGGWRRHCRIRSAHAANAGSFAGTATFFSAT
jgi:hypothetical protein